MNGHAVYVKLLVVPSQLMLFLFTRAIVVGRRQPRKLARRLIDAVIVLFLVRETVVFYIRGMPGVDFMVAWEPGRMVVREINHQTVPEQFSMAVPFPPNALPNN